MPEIDPSLALTPQSLDHCMRYTYGDEEKALILATTITTFAGIEGPYADAQAFMESFLEAQELPRDHHLPPLEILRAKNYLRRAMEKGDIVRPITTRQTGPRGNTYELLQPNGRDSLAFCGAELDWSARHTPPIHHILGAHSLRTGAGASLRYKILRYLRSPQATTPTSLEEAYRRMDPTSPSPSFFKMLESMEARGVITRSGSWSSYIWHINPDFEEPIDDLVQSIDALQTPEGAEKYRGRPNKSSKTTT